MTDERRPTAHEYRLLGKLMSVDVICVRKIRLPWMVGPVWVRDGPMHLVSSCTVNGLLVCGWAKDKYRAELAKWELRLTKAGCFAYEAERCRRMGAAT